MSRYIRITQQVIVYFYCYDTHANTLLHEKWHDFQSLLNIQYILAI